MCNLQVPGELGSMHTHASQMVFAKAGTRLSIPTSRQTIAGSPG